MESYELLKYENWMCVEDPFYINYISSYIIIILRKGNKVLCTEKVSKLVMNLLNHESFTSKDIFKADHYLNNIFAKPQKLSPAKLV